MPSRQADLITHPIRSRILAALMGRQLTTQQIADLLGDVPLASLYRHVRTLLEGGGLEAVGEARVNGTLTRIYGVVPGRAHVTPDDVSDASRAEQLQHMTTFLNTIAGNYRGYLEHTPPAPVENMTHALMHPLYLNAEESHALMDGLQALLKPLRDNVPGGDRHRMVFAHLLLPDRETPQLRET